MTLKTTDITNATNLVNKCTSPGTMTIEEMLDLLASFEELPVPGVLAAAILLGYMKAEEKQKAPASVRALDQGTPQTKN